MASWKNKVVVVTGGSDGLGLALAREFARRGARVVLLARDESRLKKIVEQSSGQEAGFDWLCCDVMGVCVCDEHGRMQCFAAVR